MKKEENGWSGGQYSLFRFLLAVTLLVLFLLRLVGRGAPQGEVPAGWLSTVPGLLPTLLVAGALASLALAAGLRDRGAAVLLWVLGMVVLLQGAVVWSLGLVYLGWLVLAHALLPAAPFGSWPARGRPDPAGEWRFPETLRRGGWWLLIVAYGFTGLSRIFGAAWVPGPAGEVTGGVWGLAEISAAGLFLVPELRRRLSIPIALAEAAVLCWAGDPLGATGLFLLHLFAFDPAWVRPIDPTRQERLFFDGDCGLCHASVRFVLAEDRTGGAFRFAPIGGETFLGEVAEEQAKTLPDSVVVQRIDGRLLTRSSAVLHLMARLGGFWRVLGGVLRVVPPPIRDRGYGTVAALRRRVFPAPPSACPLSTPEQTRRMDP